MRVWDASHKNIHFKNPSPDFQFRFGDFFANCIIWFFKSKMENLRKIGIVLEVRSPSTKPHLLSLSLHPELPGNPVPKEVAEGAIVKLVSAGYLTALLRGPCCYRVSICPVRELQAQPLPFLGANLLTMANIMLVTLLHLCLPDREVNF